MLAIGPAHKWNDLTRISATPCITNPCHCSRKQEVEGSCGIKEREQILASNLHMKGSFFSLWLSRAIWSPSMPARDLDWGVEALNYKTIFFFLHSPWYNLERLHSIVPRIPY